MPKTEAQRRASAKWDAAHTAYISCRLRKDVVAEFKAAAKEHGTTPNALICGWINDYITARK